jgi:hypothetical protein
MASSVQHQDYIDRPSAMEVSFHLFQKEIEIRITLTGDRPWLGVFGKRFWRDSMWSNNFGSSWEESRCGLFGLLEMIGLSIRTSGPILVEYGKIAWAKVKSIWYKDQSTHDCAVDQFDDSWGNFNFICKRLDNEVTSNTYTNVHSGIG